MEENSFYNKVGKINGWNFDHLQVTTEGIAKEISQEVYQLCSPTDIVLDIGTGGGERLLNLADSVLLAVGIDLSQEMIKKKPKIIVLFKMYVLLKCRQTIYYFQISFF